MCFTVHTHLVLQSIRYKVSFEAQLQPADPSVCICNPHNNRKSILFTSQFSHGAGELHWGYVQKMEFTTQWYKDLNDNERKAVMIAISSLSKTISMSAALRCWVHDLNSLGIGGPGLFVGSLQSGCCWSWVTRGSSTKDMSNNKRGIAEGTQPAHP
jgi:hypothetical protein